METFYMCISHYRKLPKTHSYTALDVETVGLILILLDLAANLGHFSSFAEVDNTIGSIGQKIGITFFR